MLTKEDEALGSEALYPSIMAFSSDLTYSFLNMFSCVFSSFHFYQRLDLHLPSSSPDLPLTPPYNLRPPSHSPCA